MRPRALIWAAMRFALVAAFVSLAMLLILAAGASGTGGAASQGRLSAEQAGGAFSLPAARWRSIRFPMAAALSPDGKYVAVLKWRLQSAIHRLDRRRCRAGGEHRARAGCVAGFDLRRRRRPHLRGRRIARRGLRVHSLRRRFARGPHVRRGSGSAARGARFHRRRRPFPDGRLLYAAELYRDSVAVINLQSGLVMGRYKTGRGPTASCSTPMDRRSSSPIGPMARWATTTPPPAASLPTCASARIPPIWRGARAARRNGGRAAARLCGPGSS